MAPFETDAEVYATLGPLLTELVQDPGTLARLREADAVVQYAFRRPEATITVDVRQGVEPKVETGATELRADLVLAMDADVGQALLSRELNPMLALARGDVRTKGPVAKLLKLVGPVAAGPSGEAPAAEPEQEAPAEDEAAPGEVEAEAPEDEAAPAEAPEGEPAAE